MLKKFCLLLEYIISNILIIFLGKNDLEKKYNESDDKVLFYYEHEEHLFQVKDHFEIKLDPLGIQ